MTIADTPKNGAQPAGQYRHRCKLTPVPCGGLREGMLETVTLRSTAHTCVRGLLDRAWFGSNSPYKQAVLSRLVS